jgi:hypothetical protein
VLHRINELTGILVHGVIADGGHLAWGAGVDKATALAAAGLKPRRRRRPPLAFTAALLLCIVISALPRTIRVIGTLHRSSTGMEHVWGAGGEGGSSLHPGFLPKAGPQGRV